MPPKKKGTEKKKTKKKKGLLSAFMSEKVTYAKQPFAARGAAKKLKGRQSQLDRQLEDALNGVRTKPKKNKK
jgi:hypothetical protein